MASQITVPLSYTGTRRVLTMPAGYSSQITCELWGAGGGGGGNDSHAGGNGSGGGYVKSVIYANAGDTIEVCVGGAGGPGWSATASAGAGTAGASKIYPVSFSGGYGGNAGYSGSSGGGGGGGGATVVSINGTIVAVAGGGAGGGGGGNHSNGGHAADRQTHTVGSYLGGYAAGGGGPAIGFGNLYTNTWGAIYYGIGIVPFLRNMGTFNGGSPTGDIIFIGSGVTQQQLTKFGIQTSAASIQRVSAGQTVWWSCSYTADHNVDIGYWIWDANDYPNPNNINYLYRVTHGEGGRQSASPSSAFSIPGWFGSNHILVMGVGDRWSSGSTGMQSTTLYATVQTNEVLNSGTNGVYNGMNGASHGGDGGVAGGGGGGWIAGNGGGTAYGDDGANGGIPGYSLANNNVGRGWGVTPTIVGAWSSPAGYGGYNTQWGGSGYAVLTFTDIDEFCAVKANNEWHPVINGYTKVDGIWRRISNAYTKVDGVWRQLKTTVPLPLNFISYGDGFGVSPRGATGYSGTGGIPQPSRSGGKIICTKLYELGLLDKDIFEADQLFGKQLIEKDPLTYYGYKEWAEIVVDWMNGNRSEVVFWKKDKTVRKEYVQKWAIKWAQDIATPWANQMAYELGVSDKSSTAGKVLMKVGLPLSKMVGYISKKNLVKKDSCNAIKYTALISLFVLFKGLISICNLIDGDKDD